MTLPFAGPLAPMLAKLQPELPVGEDWLYEPKWDGFRSIVFRDDDSTHIWSRDQRPFERYFPELPGVLEKFFPSPCVVDGEIVVAGEGGSLEFDLLQMRIHPAESRINKLSRENPASFVAFDLLADGDEDLRGVELTERRARLEKLLDGVPDEMSSGGSHVLLTPQTDDPAEADGWFESFTRLGLEGVVAKRKNLLYHPGDRAMIKVKKLKTADCVVGAYRLSKKGDGIGSLLLGMYDADGVLHFLGHTASFKEAERREILKMLRPLEGGTSFVGGRAPGGPSRWTQQELPWVPLQPKLVCEVRYDKLQGDRFRHATTFLRWRTDKKPEECTLDQVTGA